MLAKQVEIAQKRTAQNAELIGKALEKIVEMVVRDLDSEHRKTQLEAVSMWQELQKTNFNQQSEGFRLSAEQQKVILQHMENMAGSDGSGGKDGESRWDRALRQG